MKTFIPAQPLSVFFPEYEAEITLTEGRYHQIKRMLGRFRNPVLALKRIQIGRIALDSELAPGQARPLTEEEVNSIGR